MFCFNHYISFYLFKYIFIYKAKQKQFDTVCLYIIFSLRTVLI
jgi:hypothetical protein